MKGLQLVVLLHSCQGSIKDQSFPPSLRHSKDKFVFLMQFMRHMFFLRSSPSRPCEQRAHDVCSEAKGSSELAEKAAVRGRRSPFQAPGTSTTFGSLDV